MAAAATDQKSKLQRKTDKEIQKWERHKKSQGKKIYFAAGVKLKLIYKLEK